MTGTREIQLTAKQLVFIFMSTLLAAVVVFLLGVWVGRGIGGQPDAGTQAAATTVDLEKDKDRGKTKAGDATTGKSAPEEGEKLRYPDVLTGRGSSTAGAALQTPPTSPPAKPAPDPAPPAPSTPPPSAGKAAAPTGESWYVQIGAYSSKANADRQAADFKAKGYTTLVTSSPPFKVRVGPFAQKAAAEQMAVRLRKEPGVKSTSVIPSR